jgi:hypothetical protein
MVKWLKWSQGAVFGFLFNHFNESTFLTIANAPPSTLLRR